MFVLVVCMCVFSIAMVTEECVGVDFGNDILGVGSGSVDQNYLHLVNRFPRCHTLTDRHTRTDA